MTPDIRDSMLRRDAAAACKVRQQDRTRGGARLREVPIDVCFNNRSTTFTCPGSNSCARWRLIASDLMQHHVDQAN